jgi:hypothetical protein
MVRLLSNRRSYFGCAGLNLASVRCDYRNVGAASSNTDFKIDILALIRPEVGIAFIFVHRHLAKRYCCEDFLSVGPQRAARRRRGHRLRTRLCPGYGTLKSRAVDYER